MGIMGLGPTCSFGKAKEGTLFYYPFRLVLNLVVLLWFPTLLLNE